MENPDRDPLIEIWVMWCPLIWGLSFILCKSGPEVVLSHGNLIANVAGGSLEIKSYPSDLSNQIISWTPITLVKLDPKDAVSFSKLITQGSNNHSPFCFHPPKPDDVVTSGHQRDEHRNRVPAFGTGTALELSVLELELP
ncbi:unnamed protein product [Lactuca saligna]|uniref:Uncharacterized protein n=1 Tax=Lactuca saligna TaxID=75948 RepID=A0AA35ZN53_LACSI|nr:unnamed protein product [Lactuca saligna]